ncbi:MAG: HMA2 domain-containing protein [bacterium]
MNLHEVNIKGFSITHAIPGRVRLKIARVKQNPVLAGEIQKRFSAIRGIHEVEVSSVTGSVLLIFDPKEVVSLSSMGSLLEAFTSLFPEIKLEEIKGWLTSPVFVSSATESAATSALIEAFKERLEKINT